MKRLLAGLALLAITAAAVLVDFRQQLQTPLPLTAPQVVVVPPGAGLNVAIAQLQRAGLLQGRQPIYLKIYSRLSGVGSGLKAGEYQLNAGMSAAAVLRLFVSGKILLHPLRIGEGASFAEVMDAVSASTVLTQTLTAADPTAVMAALGRTDAHPEGRLFPDTYLVSRGSSDLEFLRRAVTAMDNVLAQEWEGRETDLPYASPYEALIMASIIEKETGLAQERGLIAGVFVNRLRIGMRLQTDPTVIYGVGKRFDGNLRRVDLTEDTPYNTYTRAGLPPTPICMPGRASIHAALHPEPTKALFFVSRGDGSHVFSETLEQHSAAVRQYQLGQAAASSPQESPSAGRKSKAEKQRSHDR